MFMKKNYCVYVHTNKMNGKKYVGITSRKPEQRWDRGHGYFSNKHFYKAILKEGWNEGFEHEVLFTDLTKEEAEKYEKEYIAFYQSNNPKYGYNQTKGGLGYDGFNHSNKPLMNYEYIKNDELLLDMLNMLIKCALGFEYEEVTTKILNIDNEEISKETEVIKKYQKPNLRAIDLILDNYSNEVELQEIITKITKIKENLEKNDEW